MDCRTFLLVLLMCGLTQADKNSTTGKGGKKPSRGIIVTVPVKPMVMIPSYRTQCINGGIVNLTSPAKITSPSYPYYPSNYHCTWQLQAPAGYEIKLIFTSFDLEYSTNCTNDNVTVSTGHGTKSSLLATLCGNEIPVVEATSSKSAFMTIKFHSNRYSNRRGFMVDATFINMKIARCNGYMGTITLPTTFMSPSYPNNYPANADCYKLIRAPTNMAIKLTFEDFDVEDAEGCEYDELAIHDGSSKSAHQMATLCGRKNVSPIQSSNNSMYLHFKSDQNEERRGFKIFVSFVHPGECAGNVIQLTAPVDIFSPNYPMANPKPVNCSWLIKPPEGMSVYHRSRPTYIDFGRRDCESCKLQFTYGPGSNRSESVSRCNSGYNSLQLSNGNLLINYVSQNCGGKGFRMTFLAHTRPGGPGVSVCDSTKPLTNRQYIASPLGVQGYWFSPNTHCSKLITAPIGQYVKLTGSYFRLRYSTTCSTNYVEVFDGQSNSTRSLGRFCRSFPTTVSSGRNLLVVFHSGPGSFSGYRFRLSVQFLSRPTCGGILSGIGGQLKSPHFAGQQNYLDNANCSWSINAGSNKIAYLRVKSTSFGRLLFSLEESPGCRYDSLTVYDGRDSTSPIIGRPYCGTNIPQYITGTQSNMFVQFKSDHSLSDKGFEISYNAKTA